MDFVNAVMAQFNDTYGRKGRSLDTVTIGEKDVTEAKVWDDVAELKSWEWTFGQTPEFSNMIDGIESLRNLVRPYSLYVRRGDTVLTPVYIGRVETRDNHLCQFQPELTPHTVKTPIVR